MDELIFNDSPIVKYARNTFINVPILIQYENLPLVEVVKDVQLGKLTMNVPIFHSDGTKLAVIKGSRVYATEEGKKNKIEIENLQNKTICTLDGRTIFEAERREGSLFILGELHTDDGYFIKVDSQNINLSNNLNQPLQFKGFIMYDNIIENFKIGVLLKKDGSITIGAN